MAARIMDQPGSDLSASYKESGRWPVEVLRSLFRYDSETGKLFWENRSADLFWGAVNPERACSSWNTKYAGTEALTPLDSKGYQHGRVAGKYMRAHTVAYAIHYGEYPSSEIDHINGIRSDNRIVNLREVTKRQNNWNRKSKSPGRKCGVRFRCGKWNASIEINNNCANLGTFATMEEANAARAAAEALREKDMLKW